MQASSSISPIFVATALLCAVAASGALACSSTEPTDTGLPGGSSPPPVLPSDTSIVNAGPDRSVTAGQPFTITGRAPGEWKVFWTVVSGPSPVEFGHAASWADGSKQSGFEDGTWDAWTGDDGGNETGSSRVVASRAHTGTRSWEAWNDPESPGTDQDRISAKLLRWRFDYDEAFYQAWLYWPSGYSSNSGSKYVDLFQWKERTDPRNPTWIVVAVPDARGLDVFGIHDVGGGSVERTAVPIAKDRWVHVAAWQKVSRTDGELWVWVDGRLLWKRTAINTLGALTNSRPAFLMWGVGNYGGVALGKSVWWDDAQVARTGTSNPDVTLPVAGTYVVRITASDGADTWSDEVTLTAQ